MIINFVTEIVRPPRPGNGKSEKQPTTYHCRRKLQRSPRGITRKNATPGSYIEKIGRCKSTEMAASLNLDVNKQRLYAFPTAVEKAPKHLYADSHRGCPW
jgi:hypothetical protein